MSENNIVINVSKKITNHSLFQNLIILTIIANTVMLAFETNTIWASSYQSVFQIFNIVFSAIFIIEIILKIIALRKDFYKDGWNIFDFLIVATTILPVSEGFTAMRALRVLRLLKLTSAFPSLRRVVESIFRAIPGVSSILIIFILIYIVASIMATLMFQHISPKYFGDLLSTSFSLFQVMTLESWASNIVRPIIDNHAFASVFFILFIVITNFVLINFFVAVFIEATSSETNSQKEQIEILEKKIDLLIEQTKSKDNN
ncbi:MAG: ion transporter [Parvibaculales bacterium]